MREITLQEYYDMLEKHDWWHMFSDDGRVDRMGSIAEGKLKKIAEGKPEFENLFQGFKEHWFTGEPWKTPKAPKPGRPE